MIFSGREDPEQVFFDVYFLKKDVDVSDLVLQEEEVEFVKWMSIEEIELLIQNGSFLENHAEEFYRLLSILG